MSHWDADHIAGLPEIVRRFPPDELLQPGIDLALLEQLCERLGQGSVSRLIRLLRDACGRHGIEEQGLWASQQVRDIGEGVEMYALSPAATVKRAVEDAIAAPEPTVDRLKRFHNQASLALWVRAYGRNLLLTGEIGRDEMLAMRHQFLPHRRSGPIPFDDPRCIWLKLPHHGSRSNACPELFQYFAAPRYVASASHGARWSHPHPDVLHLVHFDRDGGNRGRAMCTRLGKGCSLIRQHPDRHAPERTAEWTREVAWDRIANPRQHCYGTVTVQIDPTGDCDVSGSTDLAVQCPFGGPLTGAVAL